MNLVIGVGNLDRGDDAIGILVACEIGRAHPASATIIESTGDGTALMELWKGTETVIVIDAIHGEGEPGTVRRFDARAAPLPVRAFRCSTHAFGLADGIELSRVLNQLPGQLIVFGILGACFDPGTGCHPKIEAAGRLLARRILNEI